MRQHYPHALLASIRRRTITKLEELRTDWEANVEAAVLAADNDAIARSRWALTLMDAELRKRGGREPATLAEHIAVKIDAAHALLSI